MWITDFRESYGLSIEQLGRLIRRLGAKKDPEIRCSDLLLYYLEDVKGFCTVPAIANLIAEACGATAAQRDELVLKQYRGTWKGDGKPAIQPQTQPPPPLPVRRVRPVQGRPVVALDVSGNVVGRYDNTVSAAACCGVIKSCVWRRCVRQMLRDEFELIGFTFRYADEWDRMTAEERRADMQRARMAPEKTKGQPPTPPPKGQCGKYTNARAVVILDQRGKLVGRYASNHEAAKAIGVATCTVNSRCMHFDRHKPFTTSGYAIRYADDWDAMSEEQKLEYLGLSTESSRASAVET